MRKAIKPLGRAIAAGCVVLLATAIQPHPAYASCASPLGATGNTEVGTNGAIYTCNGTSWVISGMSLGTSITAANPQISGDATSGLYTPAASTVAIVTDGVEALRVTASQYVGIGTTAPAAPLDIQTNATGNGAILRYSSTDYMTLQSGGVYKGIGGTGSVPLRLDNGANYVLLNPTAGGNVGIGTTSPAYTLHVVGNAYASSSIATGGNIEGGGYLLVNSGVYPGGGGVGGAFLGTNGDMYMPWAGNWLSAIISDRRLKTNIADMPQDYGLATIMKLRPVTFDWRDKDRNARFGKQIGFIAQEVEKLYPQLINTGTMPFVIQTAQGKESIDHAKSIRYEAITVPLVKAVQQLKAMFDADHDRIGKMEEKIGGLKADNDNLRALVAAQGRSIQSLQREIKNQTGK